MSCSNCFNDCAEIVSDKCVRYTGPSITALGINTGDTLASIEASLTNYLQSVMIGSGITININPADLCSIINSYLSSSSPNAVELFTALIRATCEIDTILMEVVDSVAIINGNYDAACLEINGTLGTHSVLQGVITQLCSTNTALTALALDLSTNYVKLADLDTLIAAYIAGTSIDTQQYTKMVPYTAVEYYGTLSNFDGTGKGLSGLGWDKIYLCNGLNGTPDKRGRVGVGAIQLVPGGALSPVISPANPANPNYAVGDIAGANVITLTPSQIPSHTHIATVTETAHTHLIAAPDDTGTPLDGIHPLSSFHADGGNLGYYLTNSLNPEAVVGLTSASKTNLSVANSAIGGSLGHLNIQPVIACYYIMYIP